MTTFNYNGVVLYPTSTSTVSPAPNTAAASTSTPIVTTPGGTITPVTNNTTSNVVTVAMPPTTTSTPSTSTSTTTTSTAVTGPITTTPQYMQYTYVNPLQGRPYFTTTTSLPSLPTTNYITAVGIPIQTNTNNTTTTSSTTTTTPTASTPTSTTTSTPTTPSASKKSTPKAATTNNTTNGDSFRGDDKNISNFLKKTYDMVSDPKTNDIITWNEKGDGFIVRKEHEFAEKVLPKHFRHKNFSSFVRQLNFYGFRKRSNQSKFSQFKHKFFRQGQPELLHNIKRKTTEASSNFKDAIQSLTAQVADLKHQYDDLFKIQQQILYIFSRYMRANPPGSGNATRLAQQQQQRLGPGQRGPTPRLVYEPTQGTNGTSSATISPVLTPSSPTPDAPDWSNINDLQDMIAALPNGRDIMNRSDTIPMSIRTLSPRADMLSEFQLDGTNNNTNENRVMNRNTPLSTRQLLQMLNSAVAGTHGNDNNTRKSGVQIEDLKDDDDEHHNITVEEDDEMDGLTDSESDGEGGADAGSPSTPSSTARASTSPDSDGSPVAHLDTREWLAHHQAPNGTTNGHTNGTLPYAPADEQSTRGRKRKSTSIKEKETTKKNKNKKDEKKSTKEKKSKDKVVEEKEPPKRVSRSSTKARQNQTTSTTTLASPSPTVNINATSTSPSTWTANNIASSPSSSSYYLPPYTTTSPALGPSPPELMSQISTGSTSLVNDAFMDLGSHDTNTFLTPLPNDPDPTLDLDLPSAPASPFFPPTPTPYNNQ